MNKEKVLAIVEEIFSLYENHGESDYIGEPVTQLEHMCQAAELAEEEGYDDEVVLAAFFHDIGHLCEFIMPLKHMEGVGILDHESIGQDFLESKGFSKRISKLVRSHVEAKRFLTFKFPEYYDMLSDASKKTLEHQGGIMDATEAKEFEADPMFKQYIQMRKWDDQAKVIGKPLPPLQKYKDMAISHLINQQNLEYEK